mgnify:CR=1 FL=1
MASIDLTIRNKKKEAKRYEAYLKKLGKKKVEQKKGDVYKRQVRLFIWNNSLMKSDKGNLLSV